MDIWLQMASFNVQQQMNQSTVAYMRCSPPLFLELVWRVQHFTSIDCEELRNPCSPARRSLKIELCEGFRLKSMGRSPCCPKVGLRKGPWTPAEDGLLGLYIQRHGEGDWRNLPHKAGLLRCGKSCRLRWLNYLRPSIKRGNISLDEDDLIIRLHRLLGNRWSLIAGRLPGRTDNEIKNYWNSHLSKKLRKSGIDPLTHRPLEYQPHSNVESGNGDGKHHALQEDGEKSSQTQAWPSPSSISTSTQTNAFILQLDPAVYSQADMDLSQEHHDSDVADPKTTRAQTRERPAVDGCMNVWKEAMVMGAVLSPSNNNSECLAMECGLSKSAANHNIDVDSIHLLGMEFDKGFEAEQDYLCGWMQCYDSEYRCNPESMPDQKE